MDSNTERSPPDSQQALHGLTAACERIAATLDKLERLYAAEVEVYQKQRQQAEEDRKQWQERQKKWDEDEKTRSEQSKKSAEKSADVQRQFEDATKRFVDSVKPEKWQVQLLLLMIALILLGLLKASVLYLIGYWPTS